MPSTIAVPKGALPLSTDNELVNSSHPPMWWNATHGVQAASPKQSPAVSDEARSLSRPTISTMSSHAVAASPPKWT